MVNTNALKQALGGDGVHTNQFRVILNPPISLGISTSEIERLQVLCRDVTPPSLTTGIITVNQGGKPLPLRGDREYSPVSLTYLLDVNMKAHETLYAWQNLMVGVDGFTAARTHSDYVGTAIIEQLRLKPLGSADTEPDVVYRWVLRDVQPNEVTPPQFAQDNMNELGTTSVTLTYTDFK